MASTIALYTNNATTTLASGINNAVTSLSVSAGTGALFPTPTGTDYFYCTLADAATGNVIEIVKVTTRSTDTFTIVRAQQGTTASSYLAGDKVELRPTASGFSELAPLAGTAAFTQLQTFNAGISIPTGQSVTGAGTATVTGFQIGSFGTAGNQGSVKILGSTSGTATFSTDATTTKVTLDKNFDAGANSISGGAITGTTGTFNGAGSNVTGTANFSAATRQDGVHGTLIGYDNTRNTGAIFGANGLDIYAFAPANAWTLVGAWTSSGLAVTGSISGTAANSGASRGLQVATGNISGTGNFYVYSGLGNIVTDSGESATSSALYIQKDHTSGRSISAAGTINASGADYAEYERKASLDYTFNKGDIVGFDANGLLVPLVSAISLGVKTTNPSYVGGDAWGGEGQIGKRPNQPPDDAVQSVKDQYAIDLAAFEAKLEAARQWVDRVAYSGKVPVNVMGAQPGNLIVADNGGEAWDLMGDASVPDWFKKYLRSVGRVRRILSDGRAEIAVYVH